MDNTATPSGPMSGPAPRSIDKVRYPALEELRKSCHLGGQSMLDRIYCEAQALHKRATDAELELELYVEPAPKVTPLGTMTGRWSSSTSNESNLL